MPTPTIQRLPLGSKACSSKFLLRLARWHALALWCALGAALGVAAWGEGRAPLAALLLPLLVSSASTRAQAFCTGAGYAAGLLRHAASCIGAWFGDDARIGLACVGVCVVASGCVWACGWTASRRLRHRRAAMSLAWCLALLASPLVPGHPIIAAGFALPGAGWLGAALAAVAPAVALGVGSRMRESGRRALQVLLVTGAVAAGFWVRVDAYPPDSGFMQAQLTNWGRLTREDAVLQRLQDMGRIIRTSSGRVLLWPESILGRYEPALEPVLEIELLRPASAAGRTLVIGMDLPTPDNRLLNAAVAFYPDGRRAIARARQPAPLALWKPWRRSDTFVADWHASNLLELGDGQRAAVIFCFEEYVPVLYLLNEAFDAPTAYVVLANTWAVRDPEAAAIQTWHSLGMARLFGRPYLKAENRPLP